MNQLSQRDQKWKNHKLGFSTNTTIGSHGCTITCVAMLLGVTPDVVNERLKAVKGFANTNLIIWAKVKEAFPNAEFEWRGYSYENDRVKTAIEKNGACLVEVDGTPIGGDKHWVLYTGDKKLIDPWDGQEKPTSSYKAIGYSIINVNGPTPGGDMVQVPSEDFENLVKNSTEYDKFVKAGYESVEKVDEKITSLNQTISQKDETNSHLNNLLTEKGNKLEQANGRISTLEIQVSGLTERVNSLTDQAKRIPDLETENQYLTDKREEWIETEKSYNRAISQLKTENATLREGAWKKLVQVILENIISLLKGEKPKKEVKKDVKQDTN